MFRLGPARKEREGGGEGTALSTAVFWKIKYCKQYHQPLTKYCTFITGTHHSINANGNDNLHSNEDATNHVKGSFRFLDKWNPISYI